MNERIRELAVKAGMSQINRRSDGFYVVSEKTFELFAELIVRECADFVSETATIETLLGDRLKEHFGVES